MYTCTQHAQMLPLCKAFYTLYVVHVHQWKAVLVSCDFCFVFAVYPRMLHLCMTINKHVLRSTRF